MREVSTCIIWIHKRLSEVETTDIEDYIEERLQCVAPATVDRELDILSAVFTVALKVWTFSVARNPMDAVRRPRYFNERERRLKPGEEKTLLDCLSAIDRERAVEQCLHDSAELAMRGDSYSSLSARKKVLAEVRKQLRATAEQECQPVPLLEAFAHFQLMTAARRSESLGLAWDNIDFESGTAFLPETKNGRSRKLSLRTGLLKLLAELPRTSARVFPFSIVYLAKAWKKACAAGGIQDLHIHDCRHEAISRVAETSTFTLLDLQQFSGHRDTRMLMLYAHLCASKLAHKLDESFKSEQVYRVHHGRKILTKLATVKIRDVVLDSSQTDRAEESPPACVELPMSITHATEHSSTELASNVIRFPGSQVA
jgi:integrase